MFSDVAKYWKQCKTTKLIKVKRIASIWCQNDQNNSKLHTRSNYYQFASIWHQNNQKCWDTSQNIQNNAKLRKWSNYSALHRFDVKTIRNVQWRRKILKTMQNYKTDQSKKNCFYLMSKRSKQLKTTYAIKLLSICIDLTSKQSKTLRYGRKTFKTTQNYKTDQITMNCFYLMSERSKQLKTTNAIKLRSICIDLTSKRYKTFELRP